MQKKQKAIQENDATFVFPMQPIADFVWRDKYAWKDFNGNLLEKSRDESLMRVARGVFCNENEGQYVMKAYDLMKYGSWVPAGRIHAGVGTENRVTLINCYVSPTIEDSMASEDGTGILDALKYAALTQQMGGGIGMDFSTIRPNGAIVKRTNSVSTGVLPFMDMWNSMCTTVRSSGSRRGAMMATLRVDHGDIEDFIVAKHEKGRLTNFNVSVLVTTDFMLALDSDADWEIGFEGVPKSESQGGSYESKTRPGFHVYKVVKARDLWNKILVSTYEYAEPGIIFIDRVNYWNNLSYCEVISSTNPCGEQPLPPNGACNLGAVNLAVLVKNPFTNDAHIDFNLLKETVRLGQRFLDNVLDITKFPTREQWVESENKRRTGLGITGLANMLQMLRVRYASDEAVSITEEVMKTIRDEAYRTSIELAKEKGAFKLYTEKYLDAPFIQSLPKDIRKSLMKHGIRNAVILTIAPVGTTSLYYNNVSSGCEPTFGWEYTRKVRVENEKYDEYRVVDFGMLVYESIHGKQDYSKLPDYMVTAEELTVEDHVRMQAACQKYVDSSISKTINCPSSMTFEEFKNVYKLAYDNGLKGCTTYRPSGVRGSILIKDEKPKEAEDKEATSVPEIKSEQKSPPQEVWVVPAKRPEELEGSTYKVKWLNIDQAFYITINDIVLANGKRRPYEIFINSKSVQHQEWIAALTRTVSAVFRKNEDLNFLIEELTEVHSVAGGQFDGGRYVPSLVARIGRVLEEHFEKIGLIERPELSEKRKKTSKSNVKKEVQPSSAEINSEVDTAKKISRKMCPSCSAPTYILKEGCGSCMSCGYSKCG